MSSTNNLPDRPDLKDLPHTTSFNSASAYASAESSPRQSLTSSTSASSIKNFHMTHANPNDDMYKSANSSVNNSFSDLGQAGNEQASTSTLSTTSDASVVAVPNVKKLIVESIQVNLKDKPQPPPPSPQTTTTTAASPAPTTKASVLSFIEKMFVKSSPPPNQTKAALSSSSSTVGLSKDLTVLQSSISSSSPNPECSPFKLLDNELVHDKQQNHSPNYQQMKPVGGSTLSPNGTTINDAVAIFNASNAAAAAAAAAASSSLSSSSSTMTVESLKKTTFNCPEGTIVSSSSKFQTTESSNKIIESLALLNNHKEHERADPVLQSSIPPLKPMNPSSSLSSNLTLSTTNVAQQQAPQYATTLKQGVETSEILAEPSLSSLHNKHESAANIDHSVPASSREFCMNLNFNLAAAAAVFAAAPLAISGKLFLDFSY